MIISRIKFHLLCVLLFGAFGLPRASAGEVTLIGSEQIVFNAPTGGNGSVFYPNCGNIPTRFQIRPNEFVWNAPYFDGPIAPISYVSGGTTKFRFNASLGYKNYQILSNYSPSTGSFGMGTLTCAPVYTATLSQDPNSYDWAQWLYGTFRDVPNNKVYAVIYQEYYGGRYDPPPGTSSIGAMGIAVSTNNGATFSKLQPTPGHIFIKPPYIWPQTGGYGWFGGIFKSPLDLSYYVGSGGDYGTAMLRTNNLNDSGSWRAWDGGGFNISTTPVNQPYQGISTNPLYMGWSDYFKKYISVTINSDEFANGRHNLIVYNLSDDLVNWGPARKIMYNPACGPDHVCTGAEEPLAAYPAIMDPVYLSQTNDSTKASNGMTGATPLVTYIKNFTSGPNRQQFATQKVSFENVIFNRMDNFSMRGVVDGGGRSLIVGFIMQGTEAKKFVFRGIGPSLPNFGYPNISNPRISLYDGSGNLMASNLGWRSLSAQDQSYLVSRGLNPSNDAESALIVDVPGSASYGFFSLVMDNGYGMGVIEAYDMSSTAESKIAQVSVRGYSQPGNGAITMGFISRGGQQGVVRGTGASTLAPAGLTPVIPNPYVTVYNGAGSPIISNDNWGTDPNAGVIQGYGLAPGDSLESATMFSTNTVLPSNYSVYTVQLQGTGYGLLELYNVNPN